MDVFFYKFKFNSELEVGEVNGQFLFNQRMSRRIFGSLLMVSKDSACQRYLTPMVISCESGA